MQVRVVILPQLSMKKDLVLFDVGHGECILICSDWLKGFLIDCGAKYPRNHLQVPFLIEKFLPHNNSCGFVISHYHSDHYSLFQCFNRPDRLFSNIYVPDMPTTGPNGHVTYAIMEFLAVASVINFRNYRILPDIFRKCKKRPIQRKKGQFIHEAGLSFYVFWPDPSHKALKTASIIQKAKMARQKIKPWIDKYRISIADEKGVSIEQFFDLLQELSLREVPEPEERKQVEKTLRQLEGIFKKSADRLSLGFKTYNQAKGEKFLFLGDLENAVLNRITITKGEFAYDFVKASHHGTRFGKSLRKLSTEFLLVSRNKGEYSRISDIHNGYFSQMRCRLVLSTEFLGTCHIRNKQMFISR
jgi:hypothetical protein